MYLEALKKIIKDFVHMCGENFDSSGDNKVKSEISKIDSKIKALNEKDKLSSSERGDLEILELRKESWLNSASYLGQKILDDFETKYLPMIN